VEDEITRWLELPAGTEFVEFGKLQYRIAEALWPTDKHDYEGGFKLGIATLRLEEELRRAAEAGALELLDPLTFGPNTSANVVASGAALVRVSELRRYLLSSRRMGVRVVKPNDDSEPAHDLTGDLELVPLQAASEVHVDPAVQEGTTAVDAGPAEAQQQKAQQQAPKPAPLPTGDMAHCFNGLRSKDEAWWKKMLGNKPKWLLRCVAEPGSRGVRETLWNPVHIGGELVKRGQTSANSVRARFQTQHKLKPWLDAWKTYEADHLDNT
jgi:hypothetical protein